MIIRLIFLFLFLMVMVSLLDPDAAPLMRTSLCLNQNCYHICLGGGCK